MPIVGAIELCGEQKEIGLKLITFSGRWAGR